jgi:hypothetical protein
LVDIMTFALTFRTAFLAMRFSMWDSEEKRGPVNDVGYR